MRRFFTEKIEDTVFITGQEAKHIACVLRMQPKDELILFDGSGLDYHAQIVEADKEKVTLKILNKNTAKTELPIRVFLCQAIIKSDKFDYALQKCTELGAFGILPFLSERCVKKPKSAENFIQRSNRITTEAAKQCGRSLIPKVLSPVSFKELEEFLKDKYVLFAYEKEQTVSLKSALKNADINKDIYVVVGPEGGFSENEAESLIGLGAHAVSLGKRILRSETAGLCVLASIGYEYEQ